MKKVLWGSLFLMLVLTVLGIYRGKQNKSISRLPVPEYPVQLDMVSKACEDVGLFCIIESGEQTENMSTYSLRNENHDLMASIKSQSTEKGRILGVTFYSTSAEVDLADEGKKFIMLVTRLMGGLTNDEQIYNRLVKEFDSTKEDSWQADVEGVTCEIKVDIIPELQTAVMNIGVVSGQ